MVGSLFKFAWVFLRYLPGESARVLFTFAADLMWLFHLGDYERLRANLAQVKPNIAPRDMNALLRAAYRSMMRNYCDGFCLPGWNSFERLGRVRCVSEPMPDGTPSLDFIRTELAAGRSVVAGLSHSGNWDAAGAWAVSNLGSVVTVAERLKPDELFRSFVAFREGLGMQVVPLDGASEVFKTLLREARAGKFIPLLCDRDLNHAGVEVEFFGARAKFAPGPAALAEASGATLVGVAISYEKRVWTDDPRWLHRVWPRAEWGIVLRFSAPIDSSAADDSRPPTDSRPRTRVAKVQARSQRLADFLASDITLHPEDWHMMQRVFLNQPT